MMKTSTSLKSKISKWTILFSFLILVMSSPSFGQSSEEDFLTFKASTPTGNNVIISMLYTTSPGKNSYIQIYNADVIPIDLSGWRIDAITGSTNKSSNGNGHGGDNGNGNGGDTGNGSGGETVIASWDLSGTIKPGETKTAGDDGNQNFTVDFIYSNWQQKNNKWNGTNAGARLYANNILIDDAHGSTDWTLGGLLRIESEGIANTVFRDAEWSVFSGTMDENVHNCRLPIIDIGPGNWNELVTEFGRGASFNIKSDVEINANTVAECYSVYIQKNNTLSVNALAALTIRKNLNNYGTNSAFTIKSNETGYGSVIIYGISDNGTVEQYFEDTQLQQWKYISAPVENAKSAIYTNDYLMYYYEPLRKYVSITPTTTTLDVGRGYTVKKTQDNLEKYEGIFNSGDIKIPTLSNTLEAQYATDENSGWNLIGNPYTSAIDWDQVEIPSKMRGQVSVWVVSTVDGETVSDWKVWVKGLGDQEAHYIDPGEGFFVFSNYTENLTITTDAQVHHFEDASTKGVPEQATDEILEIKAIGNNFNSSFYLRFLDESTLDADAEYDAFKRLSDSKLLPQIYNKVEHTILAANSIPHPAEDDVLNLAFSCGVEGKYTLDFSGIGSFDLTQCFYLKDNLTGKVSDLRQNSSIDFDYKLSDPENRFDLVFGLINGIDDIAKDEFGTNIYNYQGNIYIKTDYPQSQKLNVEIRNLLGQTVYSATNISDFINGKNLNLPDATYLVSIHDGAYINTEKVAVYK